MFESFDRYTSIIATTSEWAANDIVLKNGELGIEVLSSTNVKIKAGDGISVYSALPYIEISDVTINTATQAALDAKTPLAGGTMTGLLVLSGDPSDALGAVTKQYVDAINSSVTTSLASKLSAAGGAMTGYLTLNADPTSALHAATKQYADTGDATRVLKVGDTMTGPLVLAADPTAALEAATKQYVDGGAYQTVVGGSSSYAGKVVKLNSYGFLDTSIVPILSTYMGTINLTTSYALTATFTVGSYFSVITTGTIDASWYTKINGAPTACSAAQFLIFNLNGRWDLVGEVASSTSIAAKLDKSGGTMTGDLILNADPTVALGAATKQYADLKLPKSGGTLTGALTLAADPTSALHPATKQYVDAADALAAAKANNLSDLASASTALTNLGGTTTGKALFTTASASAARTTLGSTTTGDALFTAASAAAGRSTLAAAASGSNTDITAVSLANTGLKLADTDASHTLSIVPSSNLTANRTLSIATGDASRTLDISAANVTVTSAGATLVGGADAAAQRSSLGLVIGTNVQAWDADLDAIGALAGTSGFLKKTAANTWTLDTSTYLTSLGIGSSTQAWDADLDAIAALAGTSGILKKTAANTWTLDTSTYLTSAVTTINFGTTGLTPATATSGAVTVAGTLAVTNGGTGAITLTGLVKGNGTSAMTAAVAGTDYVVPSALASYATLASPALTGTPTAPTAASSTNTTQIATTAMVQSAIDANLAGAAVGSVGSYGWLAYQVASTTIGFGSTTAGSNLRWANGAGNGGNAVTGSGTPSGTWRAMGFADGSTTATAGRATLFLRIS